MSKAEAEHEQRLRYVDLSPEAVATMQTTEHYLNAKSGMEPSLLEMVRLRASQLNGCQFCIGLHGHELAKRHEPAGRIDAVANWRPSAAFTERERAALHWAEVITNIQQGHAAQEDYLAAREHFSEKEIVDLTIAIASINAWNRLAIAFRPQWRPRVSSPQDPALPHGVAATHPADESTDDESRIATVDGSV